MDQTAGMQTARSGLAEQIDAVLNLGGAEAIQLTPPAVPYDVNQAAMRFPDFPRKKS